MGRQIDRLLARSPISSSDLVRSPFEGIPDDQGLVAMRQQIPAATVAAETTAEYGVELRDLEKCAQELREVGTHP